MTELKYDKMPSAERVFGNAEVIACLERWLKAAQLGTMNYVALAVLIAPDTALMDFAGSIDMEDSMPEALEGLQELVRESIDKKKAPESDPQLDASFACYEVTKRSVGYDFLIWLVAARMRQAREGAPGPLKVGFFAGKSGSLGIEAGYRKTMFENVVRPALRLWNAEEDPRAIRGWKAEHFLLKEIIEASRAGEPVPRFHASALARVAVNETVGESDPIVITLREAEAWPHRNSNKDAWMAFAKDREREGYPVVFVRDTAKATEPLEGFATYPLASTNLDIRAALYERARVGFFGANGPCDLALFGTRPWLRFQRLEKESPYEAETYKWWEAAGLEPGKPFPWCSNEQRIVTGIETYESISEAWEQLTRPRLLA